MALFRSKAEQKLVELGLDPARLPPGQYLTEKWPVLHAGTVPDVDLGTWEFRAFGEVEEPLTLTYDELRTLPQSEITAEICRALKPRRVGVRLRPRRYRADHLVRERL